MITLYWVSIALCVGYLLIDLTFNKGRHTNVETIPDFLQAFVAAVLPIVNVLIYGVILYTNKWDI